MAHFTQLWFYLASFIFGVTTLDLTILHTNDVHSRFEQTDLYDGECTKELEERGQCYGGVARRMAKIKEVRNSVENVLLLDAGDAFQGTIWFYVYRGAATAYFMNLLEYDAMSIGNHEFDLGIAGLTPFLNNITFPALSCNIDSTNEPSMQGLYVCSYVFTLPSGDKIGVVGYTFQSTPDYVQTGDLIFNPEAGSDLQQGVDDLIAMGINKIIAVGHAGIEIDKAVATTIKGVDIVIGGHTNTFLYTGTPPSNEEPYGEYPLVLSHENDASSTVLVVSAYAYSKYLGRLDVTFDDDGVVTKYGGNPILLDKNVEQDAETLKDIIDWKIEVDEVANEVVAQTFPRLEGDYPICGTQECNLGNVLADAMVFNELSQTSSGWSGAPIAMTNADSIRSSVEPGPITIGQLSRIMPYSDTLDKVTLKGEHLLQVLETSVASYEEGVPQRPFLQVSGMMVIYDVTRSSGDRVVSAMVRCADCDIPAYEPLEEDKVYAVVMNSYIAGGGGGFGGVIKDNKISQEPGMMVIYDVTRSSGDRVVSAMVRCADCDIPAYEPLEEDKVYAVVMNSYIAGGGGGFGGVIKDNKISQEPGLLDIDVTRKYLNSISYVMTGIEGRQIVYTESNPAPCYGRSLSLQASVLLLLVCLGCFTL